MPLFYSEHPKWYFIKPDKMREDYLNGKLETFDIIFTYSSVEHSGLGMYILKHISDNMSFRKVEM